MRLAVLTYRVPHRKTCDVLTGLRFAGFDHVSVLALPFVPRKRRHNPLYPHRPGLLHGVEPATLARRLAYSYTEVEYETLGNLVDRQYADYYVIAGAGLLPQSAVASHKILNAHPGLLPMARGLDAFKWCAMENKPFGVTTHLVDEGIDSGLLIERRTIEIAFEDTYDSLARRVYELEIRMLVDAALRLRDGFVPTENVLEAGLPNSPTKRMSHADEVRMRDVLRHRIAEAPTRYSRGAVASASET